MRLLRRDRAAPTSPHGSSLSPPVTPATGVHGQRCPWQGAGAAGRLGSVRHVAYEGGCSLLSANQFCHRKDYPPPPKYAFTGFYEKPASDDDVLCRGSSVIISPSGAGLAVPNYNSEGLLTTDLDFSEIVRAKCDFDFVGHSSPRCEVLTLVVKDQPWLPVIYTSTSQN